MELVVIHFPDAIPGDQLVPEVKRLVDSKIVNIVDLAFVTRSPAGEVATVERDRGGDAGYQVWVDALEAVEDLISDDDLAGIAQGVEPGMAAAVLLFEHLWARPFNDIVRRAGGELAFAQRIPAEIVDAIESAE
jgi:Family of unknown function (DUF6325)